MHVTDRFDGKTVEEARRALASYLRSGGIASGELDARLLVGFVLDLDFTAMITAAGRRLKPEEGHSLEELAQRRMAGEPVARILGVKEFWGLELRLSPATLVPRPDTETVVELALEACRAQQPVNEQQRIADIGTGSGAILLALLSEFPAATGVGTDISIEALQTARNNAANLGLTARASFVACNYMAALSGTFDLIVSNPPYIRSVDIPALELEVREHDPARALDGGPDGLDAYRAIAPQAARLLAPGGTLVVEAGYGQSGPIAEIMSASGLMADLPPKADLAGVPRAVAGRKLPR
jgi:release factor glutamine methyltransferase